MRQVKRSEFDGSAKALKGQVSAYRAALKEHARTEGVAAPVPPSDLVEDIVRGHGGAFELVDDDTPAGGPGFAERVAALEARVAEMEARVAELEAPGA